MKTLFFKQFFLFMPLVEKDVQCNAKCSKKNPNKLLKTRSRSEKEGMILFCFQTWHEIEEFKYTF